MLRRRLVSAAFVAAILITSHGVSRAGPKAVLELFTSQGCSSCPSADRLLGEFANDNSIIALSLPIDIWDYLGWKDTLALADIRRGSVLMRSCVATAKSIRRR
jgi:hypothetical protein